MENSQSYRARVLARAWTMTRVDTRTEKPRPFVIRILLVGLGVFAMWVFGWADLLIAHVGKIAALAIAAVIGGVLLFLWNIPRAAEAIQKESDDTIGRLGKQLDDKEAREAALKVLWGLRGTGVALRNEPVKSDPALVLWTQRVHSWRREVAEEAGKININLRYHLEILNEVGKPPDMPAWGHEHTKWLAIMSETLRRLEGFLCKTL